MTSSLSAISARARLFWLAGLGFGLVAVLGLIYGFVFWFSNGAFPGDTTTYYLAGLRLNEGGTLYDLRSDDVWLFSGREFPLYGPP